MATTKTKLDELLDELTDAELDFQAFAQRYYDRVSDLNNRLALELLSQGLISDPREAT
jgi:hypothetical protein